MDITIEDRFQGANAENELACWEERMDEIDLVSGPADSLTAAGEAGALIDLAKYLEIMPNLRAFLENNPIVRLSITGNTDIGAFYYAPYFDGMDDVERAPLMRADWVEKLLDGSGPFSAPDSKMIENACCRPYMPTSGKILIDVVEPDGTGTEVITKDYDAAGNIVETMNAAGKMSGATAVNMLRSYIDRAYGGYYGTKRSDLFAGQNAAWDADELVALLRYVIANPQTLNGTDSVQGIFTREDGNNRYRCDMFRLAGQLFGVRGLDSRHDYLYFDIAGVLHDARQEADAYRALQTQTVYNRTKLQADESERFLPVILPFACWQDGTLGDKYMRFTESWRSVQTMGWAVSREGAALKLIDYAYSDEGVILMSYGPEYLEVKRNAWNRLLACYS